MYVYMYMLKQMVYEPKPSEILSDYPVSALHYGSYHRRTHDFAKIPVFITGADIKGYVDSFPLYTQEDFITFMPYLANIRDDVVVKVVG